LSARLRAGLCADLDDHLVALSKCLRAQIALIELTEQGLGNIYRFDFSVKYFSFHELDYNRLCDSP